MGQVFKIQSWVKEVYVIYVICMIYIYNIISVKLAGFKTVLIGVTPMFGCLPTFCKLHRYMPISGSQTSTKTPPCKPGLLADLFWAKTSG